MTGWVAPSTSGTTARPDRAVRPLTPTVRARAAQSALRPLTVPQQLDQAAGLLTRHPRVVVPVVIALTLPVHAFVALAQWRSGGTVTPGAIGLNALALATNAGQVTAALVSLALASAVVALAGAVFAPLVVADRLGGYVTARTALVGGLRRAPAVLVAWALGHLAVLLAMFVTSGLGGAVVAAFLLIVSPVVALERAGPWRALRRSMQLCTRRFFACLGMVLLCGLVSTALSGALAALPLLAVVAPPLARIDWLLNAFAGQLASIVTVPVVAGGAAVMYVDLRVRSEGIDIVLDAERALPLGAPPA